MKTYFERSREDGGDFAGDRFAGVDLTFGGTVTLELYT